MESSEAIQEQKKSFRWVVLVLLFLSSFFVYLSFQSLPPLFKEIGEEIPLTKAQMGMIMGVLTIPSLIFAPIGGGFGDKIGARWAFGFSVLFIAVAGTLRATAGSAYALAVCMVLIGIGMATRGPNLPKALAMWFPPKELAMANGICMVSMPLGVTIGMGTAAGILSPALGGWRNVMLTLGVCTFAAGLLWLIIFRDRKVQESSGKKKPSMIANFKTVFKVKDIWWASIFYGLGTLGISSLFALLPHSLSERGLTKAAAGAYVAIMTGTNAGFKILGGTLSDRLGKRKPFLFFSNFVLGICAIIFSFVTGVPLIVALVVAGIAMGFIAPIFMATLVELKEIGPALAGTTVGLVFMVGNVFGFIGPVVSGKLMDITKAQWPGFVFMGISMMAAAFFILPVRETGQKRRKEGKPSQPAEETPGPEEAAQQKA